MIVLVTANEKNIDVAADSSYWSKMISLHTKIAPAGESVPNTIEKD
jgi:hypothetical protein